MLVFCVFLAVFYMGAVLAITLPYWYELGNTPCEDIPSSPVSPRQVGKLWLEAAWSALLLGAAFILDPIFRHFEKRGAPPSSDAPPILLVHGLYHNPSGWVYLRRQLRRAGFVNIHTMSYSSWRTNLDAVTDKLEASVRDMQTRYPGHKPLLVGHSLGGLLIRNWLAKAENQKRAYGALTLGTPHRGSKMAAVAFGALGQSLLPANEFFANLARTESPATIPCVSLVSGEDTMVLPQHCLVPVTPGWTMRVTPYAAHAGLITRGPVLRMAVWEIHRMLAAPECGEKPDKE